MRSRWFFKLFDQEMGPVDIQELQEMLSAGTLEADDVVRREGTYDWVRVRSLAELRSSAPTISQRLPGETIGARETADRKGERRDKPPERRRGESHLAIGGLLALGVVMCFGVIWQLWQSVPSRYPLPRRLRAAEGGPSGFWQSLPWDELTAVVLWLDGLLVTGLVVYAVYCFWKRRPACPSSS